MTSPADQILRESLRGVLASATDHDSVAGHDSVAAALADQGWPDVVAAEGDLAWQLLFEEFAAGLSSAHPLDLLLEPVFAVDGRVTRLIYATERTEAQRALDARLGRSPLPRGVTRSGAQRADRYVLLVARCGGGFAAAEVDAGQVSLEPVQGMDPDFRLRMASLHASPDPVAVGTWIIRALALQSWALHALSERMLAIATEHVTVRRQFGRPVGSFQAVKHMLADCAVELESERAVLTYASQAQELVAVTAAKAMAGRTSLLVGQAARQSTGAMGFSSEFPLHRYLRRARSYDLMLGSWELHTRNLGQLVLDRSALPRLGSALARPPWLPISRICGRRWTAGCCPAARCASTGTRA
jgi:hypothetical protein